MNDNQNTEQKSSKIEWEELWEVTKKWAVMSQWENDLEKYGKLQETVHSGPSGD